MSERASSPRSDWRDEIFAALKAADIRQVGYVPDAGHARLIELCQADPDIRAISLTTEEEGIALAAGAWLGGQRARAVDAVERGRQLHQHAVAGEILPFSAADAGDDARRMGRVQPVAGGDGHRRRRPRSS